MNNYLDAEGSNVCSEDEFYDSAAEKREKLSSNAKPGALNVNDQTNQNLIPGLQDNNEVTPTQSPIKVEVHGVTPADLSDYGEDINTRTLVNIPAEIAENSSQNQDGRNDNHDVLA